MKTLVISNSNQIQYCITKALKNSQAIHVKNTLDATSLLKQEDDFELVFLDDTLNHSDVIVFFIMLREFEKPLQSRTLFLTDNKESDVLKKILEIGCSGSISKCSVNEGFLEELKPHLEVINLKRQLEKNNNHQHSHFKTIYQKSPIGIVVGKKQRINGHWVGVFLDLNEALEKITKYEKTYLLQHGWEKITHPDDVQSNRELYQAFYEDKIKQFTIEKRYIQSDGEIVWVMMDVVTLETDESTSTFLCLIQNITERKLIEQALIESERSKTVLLSNLPGMAYRCNWDKDWTMKFVSSGSYELTGYTPEDLIDNKTISYNDLIDGEYQEVLRDRWQETLTKQETFEYEYEIICADKTRKWVLERGEVIFDNDDQAIALEGIVMDITRRKEYEERLKFLSEHDALTGLYNREYLATVLRNVKSNDKCALMILNFNRVNALSLSYGFSFSEQIMRELSKLVLEVIDNKFDVYQVSFERLAIFVEHYDDQESLIALANNVIATCMTLDITKLIGCNIGILQIDTCDCDMDVEQIIKNASIASEQHYKQMTSVNFFTNDLSVDKKRETDIRNALIQYLDNQDDHFYLNFQPIIETKTKKVIGFEALSRFEIDDLGSIPPSEFIPLAEETQIILPLGDIIIEKACKFKQICNEAGYPDILLSINISTLQFLKEGFVTHLLELFSRYSIDLKTIELEVTESIFTDSFTYLNEKLQQLRSHGVRIAIDDFGSGYSSLARERELKVDTIKIDKQFIDRIFHLQDNELVTSDIIAMAHKLKYRVIAEGVENKKQYDYLKKYYCDFIQGYYFSKPLSMDKAVEFLQKQNG